MLYSEFIEGTGCRDKDCNYLVYKRLELIYMNDESVTKQDIYEMGKKLVDNSDTAEQIAFKEQLQAEIALLKNELKQYRAEVKRYDEYYKADKTDKFWKDQRDWSRHCAKVIRNKIEARKLMLG